MQDDKLEVALPLSGFSEIENSLVCIDEDFFERDKLIIFDEYMELYRTLKTIPSVSEVEDTINSINWSICYDMAEFLTDNSEDHKRDMKQYAKDNTYLDSDEARLEFISMLSSEIFNDIYWWNTQEIRDSIKRCLRESFIVYIDDMPYENAILIHSLRDIEDRYAIYANSAQTIMFNDLYEDTYGKDSVIETDNGHVCNHLVLRKCENIPFEGLRIC